MVHLYYNALWNAGNDGFYSTATNADKVWGNLSLGMYSLFFSESEMRVLYGPDNRYQGIPERCLAPGA